MKQITFVYLIPFLISVTAIYFAATSPEINDLLFIKKIAANTTVASDYISSYQNDPALEDQFLAEDETVFLIGSSELSSDSKAIPYRFITEHFSTNVKAFGHAGNQCFSIFCQLLENREKLKNAKIVFVISPSWFESKSAKGVTSAAFLEYHSKRTLQSLIAENEFNDYAFKRISDMYNEFNSPNIPLKWMNFNHHSSKSVFHKTIYAPFISFNDLLWNTNNKLIKAEEIQPVILKKERNNASALAIINWDSLLTTSREKVLKNAGNNNMGIENNYYSQYINGKTGRVQPVPQGNNRELEDFKMLVKLIRTEKINASFVISPLNPHYYINIAELSETMNIVIRQLERKASDGPLPLLNFFVTDTSTYDKALLHDVMHLSDHSWYITDKFITNTYNLKK